MKQVLILSGKGGTGKTTVAGAFIALADARAWADCDVDAPNLHLVAPLEAPHALRSLAGLPKAVIDGALCTGCDVCHLECRFGAIDVVDGAYTVDPFACEGCGLCARLCPAGAIGERPWQTGIVVLAADDKRVFSTAVLTMGSGNSGKLVWAVKRQLAEHALPRTPLAVIDGSPGIGCPVMSSMSGVDLVLLVAEPSVAGLSDLKRLLDVAVGLGVEVAVCTNRADINATLAESIRDLCTLWGLPYLGDIPFDPAVPAALNAGRSIAADPGPAGVAIRSVFAAVLTQLGDVPSPN